MQFTFREYTIDTELMRVVSLTTPHKPDELVPGWLVDLFRSLQVLKHVNVRGKSNHVLFCTAIGHPDQIAEVLPKDKIKQPLMKKLEYTDKFWNTLCQIELLSVFI